jgi:hypothetical protein
MRQLNIDDLINEVLMEWDPLQIGEMNGPLNTEYLSYILRIKNVLYSNGNLTELLEGILTEEMGLNYSCNNVSHKKDLMAICNQLKQLINL